MKILLVSSFLPFPLYSGGHIRLFNLIKELSAKHEITLVCEIRDHQTKKDIEAVEKFCTSVITIKRKKQWSASNILKSIFSSNAFLITGHTLPEMKQSIKQLLSETPFDLIHCETSYVFQNIPETKIPLVLVEHNIEYTIYEKYAKQKGKLLAPLLLLDVRKLKRIEESFWKKAEVVVAVSEKEEKVMRPYAKKTAMVSNGVDLKNFKFQISNFKAKIASKKILFIGDFSYIQNQDAARFLITEIYPRIKEKDSSNSIKLWIVGRKIPQSIKESTTDPTVIFDENATQPTPEIFSAAALLLAPLRVGGGTQYKILESLSVGTPVVTTSLGKEGLAVTEDKDILIANSPSDLATKVLQLFEDEALYKHLSLHGRKLIEEHYSWIEIAHKLDEVYTSVVK